MIYQLTTGKVLKAMFVKCGCGESEGRSCAAVSSVQWRAKVRFLMSRERAPSGGSECIAARLP